MPLDSFQPCRPTTSPDGRIFPTGEGVPNYVNDRYECKCRLRFVLVAFSRFNHIVHTTPGSEEQKVAAARAIYSNAYGINVGALFNAMNKGGGVGGVLGVIFWFSLSEVKNNNNMLCYSGIFIRK